MSLSTFTRRTAIAAFALAGLAIAMPARAELSGLEILAPSNPGSGWDQTARALQSVLEAKKLAGRVQVLNVGGGGGTVGLAQFVTTKGRRDDALMLSGLAMVSGVLINQSAVTLDQVRPLARLIGEYEVIVVPKDSPIKSLEDLMAKFKADPKSVSWGAGSAGSADHLLVGMIAEAAGVDPAGINYIGHSGGGEALAAILGGHVTVGVSGYQEFASQIKSGDLRALGISAAAKVEDIDVPTFKEQGLDIEFVNWRGIMAPEKISDADFKVLADVIDQAAKSPEWAEALKTRGWIGMYQPEAEFVPFLKQNRAEIEKVLKNIGLVK
ncbi:C4-dicarboxylate ABC transporter substrate-binding protein [Agaricicola taiwanensis]|uniref:C4-dicarboxylate ABC transporter substrate-binding protein n=1 Tax=Agaricicola taiwanensis TaxID=591372 RepID=A0A8J2YHN4_9RHOB|nr:tripartite tricarboxylate transporter substrate-binding protein [Agaricicola taiwanensis]GGE43589.1 C4-dicarboxylate ABC transporter substrate-binding protein [Agaricicola taiwanensis]